MRNFSMEEKSAFEILQEYANQKNLTIKISEQEHKKMRLHPGREHQRSCYIPDDSGQKTFFYCYTDSKFTGDYSHFCGIFFVYPGSHDLRAILHKKDIIDRISLLFKKEDVKTGDQDFDSKVYIKSNGGQELQTLLSGKNVKDAIVNIFEVNEAYRVVINEINPDLIPELNGQPTMGILNPRTWIFEQEKIDKLFELGRELKGAIY